MAARPRPAGLGAVVLVVLALLAAAAGLGAAALVKSREATWQARGSVAFLPGADVNDVEGAQALGKQTYLPRVQNSSFTAQAVFKAGLADGEVREDLQVVPYGDSGLTLVASASSAPGAVALANAAVVTLVSTVESDQVLTQPEPGLRLTPSAVGPATTAERVTPSTTSITVAGVLTGLAVLVLGLALLVLRRVRRTEKDF